MSQRLSLRTRKNGNAKGVAIRKNKSNTPSLLKSLFMFAFDQSKSRRSKNGKG